MDPRLELIRDAIRDVPDFPKPGILFKDITPILGKPDAFRAAVDLLCERYRERQLDHIVAIESRGFLFGAPLALELGVPLNVVRKPGKLPWKTDEISYSLEYGESTLEIHQDELTRGGKTLVIDDLLATGGTAAAACQLVEKQGATVEEVAFIIELGFLEGKSKISAPCFSLLSY